MDAGDRGLNTDTRYALVGAFVVLLGIVALAIPLWWTGAAEDRARDTYLVYTRQAVSGLNLKAPVKYRGVTVGEVTRIELDDVERGRVRVRIDVQPDTPISVDTIATLTSQGITGLTYFELSGGDPSSPELEASEGADYPVIPARPSLLVRLDSDITEVVATINEVGASIVEVADRITLLMDQRNLATTARTLANIEATTERLSQYTAELASSIADVKALTANTREFTDALPAIANNLGEVTASLPAIVDNVTEVSESLPAVTQRLTSSLDSVQRSADAVAVAAGDFSSLTRGAGGSLASLERETVPRVQRLMREAAAMVGTLERLGRDLERHPNKLLYGRGDRRGPGE